MFYRQAGGFLLVKVDGPFAAQRVFGRDGFAVRRQFRGQGKPERGALAQLTLKPDLAAHFLNQALGDRKPQSGATVLPGSRRVGLAEGVEQGLLLSSREPDTGIGNAESQGDPVTLFIFFFKAGAQDHFTGLGELDGIVDQVGDHLLYP